MQLLIEKWNKELQQPLEVLEYRRDYHINAIVKAQTDIRELRKRIGQATELLETEREQIEEAQQNKQTCGFCVEPISLDHNNIPESVYEPKEVEMIECPDCNGEGTWYNDTSRQCTTYRGDCCGGCGYYVDCDTCNGTGEIEKEEE